MGRTVRQVEGEERERLGVRDTKEESLRENRKWEVLSRWARRKMKSLFFQIDR